MNATPMSALVAFVRLSRIQFLAGGFAGGALGTAIASFERGAVSWPAFLLAQFTITAAHLMTQLANEYYDLESDALTTRTKFSGGSGVLVSGQLPPRVALIGALACACANACGVLALIATGHFTAAVLGALCAVFAWAYSAPPARLLARGFGELDTSLVVAILVPLCAYAAQSAHVSALAVVATLPGAAAIFAMMMSVEMPDIVADAATGKRNLVVRLGLRRASLAGLAALAITVVATILVAVLGAPRFYLAAEAASGIPIVWLAIGLLRLRAGADISFEGLARRGVVVFLTVGALGALGFAGGSVVR